MNRARVAVEITEEDRARARANIARIRAMAPPRSVRTTVYVIQGEGGGPIKIGFTARNVHARLEELQKGSPVRLVLLRALPGERALERDLHRRFAAYRLHGEWFHPADEILAYAKEGS